QRTRDARQQRATDLGELHVRLAGDYVIGERDDLLPARLEAHFRSANDDRQVGTDFFQNAHHLRCQRRVPNVNAEADNARLLREDALGDLDRALLEIELHYPRVAEQLAHVREQVAQTECGVDVLRVERGQDDFRHAAT